MYKKKTHFWSVALLLDSDQKPIRIPGHSVADPDPVPSDPYVLGPLDPDPDPLVRGTDPDPDSSITKQE
jgi:hypothetical protein